MFAPRHSSSESQQRLWLRSENHPPPQSHLLFGAERLSSEIVETQTTRRPNDTYAINTTLTGRKENFHSHNALVNFSFLHSIKDQDCPRILPRIASTWTQALYLPAALRRYMYLFLRTNQTPRPNHNQKSWRYVLIYSYVLCPSVLALPSPPVFHSYHHILPKKFPTIAPPIDSLPHRSSSLVTYHPLLLPLHASQRLSPESKIKNNGFTSEVLQSSPVLSLLSWPPSSTHPTSLGYIYIFTYTSNSLHCPT